MIQNTQFKRQAIRSRMLETAARLWGYDNTELESFDPLVNLLMSALAKELEKAHHFFENSYDRVLENLIESLIPSNKLNFHPASAILNIHPNSEKEIITKENLAAIYNYDDGKKQKNFDFVPIVEFTCTNQKVSLIANGSAICTYEKISQNEQYRYLHKDNSIYIGIDIGNKETNVTSEIELYIDWPNVPDRASLFNILYLTKWFSDDKLLEIEKKKVDTYKNQIDQDSFWNNYPVIDEIKSIYKDYSSHCIIIKNPKPKIGNVPEFIKKAIQEEPKLSIAHDLFWVRIELPPHHLSKSFAQHLYCQTNCFPFINLNHKKQTRKVKSPFKILKISGDEYFVDIHKIENAESIEYIPKSSLQLDRKIAGHFLIHNKGVQRINQQQAKESIDRLLDIIKEERTAFASQNPDWIAEELGDIKKIINRIEKKLNTSLKYNPNDVFIEFENDSDEEVLTIDYWSSDADLANKIPASSYFKIRSDIGAFTNAMSVTVSSGGKGEMNSASKIKAFQRSLLSRKTITTKHDISLFIETLLIDYNISDIDFNIKYQTIPDLSIGYKEVYEVVVTLKNGIKDEFTMSRMREMIERQLNENTIMGFEITVKLINI